MMNVNLLPLDESDCDQFILDTQEAFNYGAMEEFGRRDDHFEEDEQIISRETIENSIDNGEAYRIVADGMTVGGVIIRVEGDKEMILVEEVDNKEFLRELARAIQGRGAFRRFKDTVYDLGIDQKWYDYQAKAYKRIATRWCEANDIEYEE